MLYLLNKKCRLARRHFKNLQLLALALLIGNTAAGLAGRLAGSLALAAAALLGALAKVPSLDSVNVLHGKMSSH